MRENKGKSLTKFVDNYTVLDLETTGLSPTYDNIIEIAAIKVKNNKIIETYQQLINPGYKINDFISSLTGITNEMLSSAPKIDVVIHNFLNFVSNDVIVGHNVNFDINFMYDNVYKTAGTYFSNDFIDTMRLSRKLFKEEKHHRLLDVAKYCQIDVDEHHRALADCNSTFLIYNRLKEVALEQYGNLDSFSGSFRSMQSKPYDYKKLRELTPDTYDFDETHPLYHKSCVFTGTLEKMTRTEAAQLVLNCGGVIENNITKKTNILVLGNNDYCKSIKDSKSTKQKKAEEYIIRGQDLIILPEDMFYSIIEFSKPGENQNGRN